MGGNKINLQMLQRKYLHEDHHLGYNLYIYGQNFQGYYMDKQFNSTKQINNRWDGTFVGRCDRVLRVEYCSYMFLRSVQGIFVTIVSSTCFACRLDYAKSLYRIL